MYIVCVTVKVKPGKGDAFLEAALADRVGTRTEPGNIRFDVLRGLNPPDDGSFEPFFLFEIYHSPEDFAYHQTTPHFLVFRDAVVDLMAEPRQGIRYTPVYADSFVPGVEAE